MIEFKNVSKTFTAASKPTAAVPFALKDVSFQIEAGELVFVAGHSGAGKSTLLRMIAGLDQPTSGQVQVQSADIGRLPRSALPYLRRHVGIVFQEQKLLFDRSVLENVRLPLLVTGHSAADATQRAQAALQKVGLAANVAQANPAALSGGEQQLVAIARALVNRPAILLADEPTANLDRDTAVRVIEAMRDFVRVGVTALISTHDEFLLEHFRPRVLRLAQGQLIADQSAREAA
jgi:cell division transport system ATP-binding protein